MIGKRLTKNNQTIALNVFYIKKKKYVHLISQKLIKALKMLMISNGKNEWYYLSVKKLSKLLRRITSKNHSGFYRLNCLHSFRTEI